MHKLADDVRQHIIDQRMFAPGAALLVAVSGGADSVALLELLRELQAIFALRLVVGHVNHAARGAESDADARFVAQLASDCELAFDSETFSRPPTRHSGNVNLEEAFRQERYRLLCQLRVRQRCDYVCVGHTADDQAETILQHWIQGASLQGLGGMADNRPDGIIRPLLRCTGSELRAYLAKIGRPWREDSSNTDLGFSRNYLRHCVIPLLTRLNPNLSKTVSANAAIVRTFAQQLEAKAGDIVSQLFYTDSTGFLFPTAALRSVDPTLRAAVISRMWQVVRAEGARISSQHIEQVSHKIEQDARASLRLPGRVACDTGHQWCQLTGPRRTRTSRREFRLAVPCTVPVYQLGGLLSFAVVPQQGCRSSQSLHEWHIPLDCLGDCPRIMYRPETSIASMKMAFGHRSLKRLMIDCRIPWFLRDSIPLLLTEHGVAWAWGIGSAEWAANRWPAAPSVQIRWDSVIDWSMLPCLGTR